MSAFRDATHQAMLRLAKRDPSVLFLGQNVAYPGHALYETLDGIPMDRRIELPVAEAMQMGMGTGLSLAGYLPVSCYRMDFLLLALDQLVNHLDKLAVMSAGQFRPKVIIRAMVTPPKPLDPGPQHRQNHADAIAMMLQYIPVVIVDTPEAVMPAYVSALESGSSTVIVEVPG